MAKNNKEIRDIYFEYYRTKRSREFMDQHDSWKSWLELKEKIERKRNRRVARRISVAATVAVLVAFAAYLRVVYVHEEREPVTVAVSYSFPEMKSNKAILSFSSMALSPYFCLALEQRESIFWQHLHPPPPIPTSEQLHLDGINVMLLSQTQYLKIP